MEAAGLALGAAGLLTAFNGCLEALELIDLGKAHARDITLLEQMFDNQHHRLSNWAKTYFPSVDRTSPELYEPDVKQRLLKTLLCISLLFQDRDKLAKRYGAGVGKSCDQRNGEIVAFGSQVRRLGNRVQQRQAATRLSLISSWAVRDRRKFRELVDDVSRFVTDLEMTTQALSKRYDQGRAEEAQDPSVAGESPGVYGNLAEEIGGRIQSPPQTAEGTEDNIERSLKKTPTFPCCSDRNPSRSIRIPACMTKISQTRPWEHKTGTLSVLFVDYGNSCKLTQFTAR
jgi:hypothetical protein